MIAWRLCSVFMLSCGFSCLCLVSDAHCSRVLSQQPPTLSVRICGLHNLTHSLISTPRIGFQSFSQAANQPHWLPSRQSFSQLVKQANARRWSWCNVWPASQMVDKQYTSRWSTSEFAENLPSSQLSNIYHAANVMPARQSSTVARDAIQKKTILRKL